MPLRRHSTATQRRLARAAEQIVLAGTDMHGHDHQTLSLLEARLVAAARDLLGLPHDRRGHHHDSPAPPPCRRPEPLAAVPDNVIAFPAARQ